MNLSEYQQKAIAFANPDLSPEMAIATRCMGLAGETGELIDLIKKHLEQGHPLDLGKVKNELGDCLYYVSAIAHHFGFTLEEIAAANIEKLTARYGDRFSVERSLNRVVECP